MIYRIRHITEYTYNRPVSLCYNQAHLLPRSTDNQICQNMQVNITPKPDYFSQREDYFGNNCFYFSLQKHHKKLVIDVTTEIDTQSERASLDLDLGKTCSQVKQELELSTLPEVIEAKEFLLDSPMIKISSELKDYAQELFDENRPLCSAVRALTTKIFNEFKYDPSSTNVATPLHEALEKKSGVCQDFAHIAIGCLRAMGYPARYISGYLETLPPPGEEKLIGADASHAWFAVYSPGEGWFEFDPTNDDIPADQHITTAWGRDYSDVTPLRGVVFDGGNSQELSVSVDVRRLS
ncbi:MULTISPECIES: transglutaminase family protein [unclassified Neptuniibacter]|uniref:transglutaminase family protein n=1 Tax=unclassified Neptuniibacter TaxID=2630693 RepID=UPI000C4465E0|nr:MULTISPECIES: transglutaminase family protein [unclassified Neptuniibacter]MAY42208.1 transglutaminase [Oceanospirillaceae bacterium]|tara:strand:- start:21741 stop:22622 length:882 start_codon:yes stop_codon:yes gene_type:complete